MEKERNYWLSPIGVCDDCGGEFTNGVMYDAKTQYGPWGNLCQACFSRIGVGLGIGYGQKYVKQADGKWLCTEGGSK